MDAGVDTSAAGPALGYLVQADLALLQILQALPGGDLQFSVSIETLDDIVVHRPGGSSVGQLLQSKHHSKDGGIGDRDADLWKTLFNWSRAKVDDSVRFVLITTRTAKAGTAAFRLKSDKERNVPEALGALMRAAEQSQSKELEPYFSHFLGLGNAGASDLLSKVEIIDDSPTASGLRSLIERAVGMVCPLNQRSAYADSLCGWWQAHVTRHLTTVAAGQWEPISAAHVQDQIYYLNTRVLSDNLLFDTTELAFPSGDSVEADERVFVQQLRRIALSSARMGQCIYDHNRAFQQRSYWQRNNLVNIGELARYDEMLKDEWRRYFLATEDDIDPEAPNAEEAEVQRDARRRFDQLDRSQLPPIRSAVMERHIANGSLHMLAGEGVIGWHPNWLSHLRELLGDFDMEGAR